MAPLPVFFKIPVNSVSELSMASSISTTEKNWLVIGGWAINLHWRIGTWQAYKLIRKKKMERTGARIRLE